MKYRLYSGVRNEFVSEHTWDSWDNAYCEKCEKFTPEEVTELDIYVEDVSDAAGT